MAMSDRLRREDYEVRDTPLSVAQDLVRKHHYARGGSNTAVYVHGLYERGGETCLGVAWWLPPTKVAAQSVAEDWRGVICLTRLVVVPDVPKNAATFLLGNSIRAIRRDGRFHTLLTYADERQGHTGAIYRASNWEYMGVRPGSEAWVGADGRQVAKKATHSRTTAQMLELGYTRIPPSRKHKYVMRLR